MGHDRPNRHAGLDRPVARIRLSYMSGHWPSGAYRVIVGWSGTLTS
jgi:hypothetical protein